MDKQSSYKRVRERMEELVVQIRSKDLPLEKSLDLYEEALRLGSIAAEMIDRTDFGFDELTEAELESVDGDAADEAEPGADDGAEPGADYGAEPGVDDGAEPGIDDAADTAGAADAGSSQASSENLAEEPKER